MRVTLRDELRSAARKVISRRAVNSITRLTRVMVGATRFDAIMGRGHRSAGYRLLNGRGIEIGALHAPAPLPKECLVTYVDAISTAEAKAVFPEVDPARLVAVDIVTDMDRDGLAGIENDVYDFVVMNHVIEHVANPIKVIAELFRVVRPGGIVVISAPDMRFSFDRHRPLTTNEHLTAEYLADVREVQDDHYEDFARHVLPHAVDGEELVREVALARERREHAHVWDSSTFGGFLQVALDVGHHEASMLYSSIGDQNRLEHFSVWRKAG